MKIIENDKKLPNLRVLKPIRVYGVPYAKGDVVAKSAFATQGDWLDLCAQETPWLEQTADAPSRAAAAPATKRGRSVAPAAAPTAAPTAAPAPGAE